VSPFLRREKLFISERKQSGYTPFTHKVHATAITPITAVRTSQGNELLSAKTDYTISSRPGLNINLNSVYQLSVLIRILLIFRVYYKHSGEDCKTNNYIAGEIVVIAFV
jgi:hypothetical protein